MSGRENFNPETKFLIVDDLKTIRSLLKDILRNLGYRELVEAENGKQALKLLQNAADENKGFDLIVCDWNMPEMSGLELLEARNSDPRLKNIPFLMVTIESELEYVLKAISNGVSDFVVKPFSEKTIEGKLKSIYQKLYLSPR